MVPKKVDPSTVRTQVVTVRLDPKLKYLAELAARKQRRTLSSYIEWAVERSLDLVALKDADSWSNTEAVSVMDAEKAKGLWDVDETDRLPRLAINFPELLTHEEQVLWKLIRECGFLWRGGFKGADSQWTWTVDLENLVWGRLREKWDVFRRVARGDAPHSELPTWPKTKVESDRAGRDSAALLKKDSKPPADLDDDIPF